VRESKNEWEFERWKTKNATNLLFLLILLNLILINNKNFRFKFSVINENSFFITINFISFSSFFYYYVSHLEQPTTTTKKKKKALKNPLHQQILSLHLLKKKLQNKHTFG
jgi:hypothetical protein